MTCKELEGMLDRLMDDELTDGERQALEEHGQTCPDCAEAIRATMQMKALFAEMEPEADVPLEAQAQWRGAVREEARRKGRGRLLRWVGSAAAAVVVLAGVGLALNVRGARQDNAPQLAQLEVAETEEAPVAYEEPDAGAAYESALVKAEPAKAERKSSEAEGAEPMSAAGSAEYAIMAPAADSAFEAEAFDMAENAILEIDGEDAPMCAALAQRGPARELRLHVEDVDAACDLIRDLAAEYEAEADVQRMADGGANVYVEVPMAEAEAFINAATPIGTSADAEETDPTETEAEEADSAEAEEEATAEAEEADSAPSEAGEDDTILMMVTISSEE